MSYLRFGTFIPPIHPVGENPLLCLERDMQTVQHLDALGYDEAWIGEHHSAGAELIASPEVFIAVAAERTKHIRLGTGVSSLPYHHPLILADRIIQLSYMTRGRAMFGVGPGALVSDAAMMGIQPIRQRDMMEEALDCIIRLFNGETVTYKTDWFELKNAHLQLPPYGGKPIDICTAAVISPSGPRAAGRFGTGLLSLSATSPEALVAAAGNWQVACETADRYGNVMDRSKWRMLGIAHVAESREQAMADINFGFPHWIDYFDKISITPMVPKERLHDAAQFLVETGKAVIGTPDDCIKQIETLEKASGGFGAYLITDTNWVAFDRKLKSYELIARYVMPRFQMTNVQRAASDTWARASRDGHIPEVTAAKVAQFDRLAAERAQAAHRAEAAE
jgi:limonene 1,2-monooxygenase